MTIARHLPDAMLNGEMIRLDPPPPAGGRRADALSLYRRSRPTAGGCRKGALSAVDPEAG
jgi:hypothetical protein